MIFNVLDALWVRQQIIKMEAIEQIKNRLFDIKSIDRDIKYACEKLEILFGNFDHLMNEEPKIHKSFLDNSRVITSPKFIEDFVKVGIYV